MKLPTAPYPFVFLSACFSGTWEGKNAQASELRIPPVRGHLRLWHRVLYSANDANRVWGNAAGNEGSGSRVGVTLKLAAPPVSTKAPTLPHKEDRFQGPRAALAEGTKASLVLHRLPGCTAVDWEHAQNATKLWRLLGSIGNRSNRAAGSAWPDDATAPASTAELRSQLSALGCKWALALAPTSVGTTWQSLRKAASDTIKDAINYGTSTPRTPSPTHFKIVRFGTELRLLVFAANGNRLSSAMSSMAKKPIPALSKPNEWVEI